jgi:hypothetical protein
MGLAIAAPLLRITVGGNKKGSSVIHHSESIRSAVPVGLEDLLWKSQGGVRVRRVVWGPDPLRRTRSFR